MAKTILVVDDSPSIREVVGGFLESAGYDVITADSGVSA
ncbi:MAG: response regulator, partial [Betaproteobacteria bacterium]|nr:response regulator [Betaproteobacteria bacterium]